MSYINKVAIIMGSDSDLSVMKDAAEFLEILDISYEITIVSAHRTPEKMVDFGRKAHEKYQVIIAGAGGSAHLPGMVASFSHLPVIGVPIHTSALSGIDSLYSIVQMPKGVVVATVAINNAHNAALLAAQMLALKDERIQKKIIEYKKKIKNEVEIKAEKLEKIGYEEYFKSK